MIHLDLENTIRQEQALLEKLKKRLEVLPTERISSRKQKGHYRYSIKSITEEDKVHEQYLGDDKQEFIIQCSEAYYLRKLIPVLERELSALEAFRKRYEPSDKFDVWESMPEGLRLNTKPLLKSKRDTCIDWERAPFQANTFPYYGDARYLTKKGESVRSRIELITANLLYDLGLSYRYECRLDLPSGIVYPDFTVMHPDTLQLYYIEIFGMMDDEEYSASAFSKIAKYAESDCYSHLLMFFDHKNAALSIENVKETLEAVFLKC